MTAFSRREMFRLAIALPAAGIFTRFNPLVAAEQKKVKITDIKAMQINRIAGNCLIKIETDAGIVGYGEAGMTGPMARARIATMKPLLIGKDPLAIEVHFQNMTSLMHTYMASIPTISGIDIALWDIAGKITGLPISTLLGGPFRESIRMYSHGRMNMLDKASCQAFADRVKQMPEGFNAFKNDIHPALGIPMGRFTDTLDQAQLKTVARAYNNAREALGDDIEIAVHCHNEFNEVSSVGIAKAVASMNPLFMEDPLNPPWSEAWQSLRRQSPIPLLTGEKLEMLRGFKPFIDNQTVDILHPDLAFAGGFTGVRKIADYAYENKMPLALHNVGSLVLTFANAHFGSAIHNFYRSESQLGETGYIEPMAASNPPEVRKGYLKVPTGPGLGFDINPDFLKKNLTAGEEYWG
jgi:L-alanine-DL-glutamate epimerase-like enolase superfamily enzyme